MGIYRSFIVKPLTIPDEMTYYIELKEFRDRVTGDDSYEKLEPFTTSEFLASSKILLAKLSHGEFDSIDADRFGYLEFFFNSIKNDSFFGGITSKYHMDFQNETILDLQKFRMEVEKWKSKKYSSGITVNPTTIEVVEDMEILRLEIGKESFNKILHLITREVLFYESETVVEISFPMLRDSGFVIGPVSGFGVVCDDLSEDNEDFERIFLMLGKLHFNEFMKTLFKKEVGITIFLENVEHKIIMMLFQEYMKKVIRRRESRILNWLTKLFKWGVSAETEGIVKHFREEVVRVFELLKEKWTICEGRCRENNGVSEISVCFFSCSLLNGHEKAGYSHNCSFDHTCHKLCEICLKDEQKEIGCGVGSGHAGMCFCESGGHKCDKECCLFSEKVVGCEKICDNYPDHELNFEEEEKKKHYCKNPIEEHKCGEDCSGTGCGYYCHLKVNHDEGEVHNCLRTGCQSKCCMCNRKCCSEDHFHRGPHFCDNEHSCTFLCENEGVCGTVESRMGFYEEIGKRKCSIKIPPFLKYHERTEGSKHLHVCGSGVHTCKTKCSSCRKFCEKEFGHEKRDGTKKDQLHFCNHGKSNQKFRIAGEGGKVDLKRRIVLRDDERKAKRYEEKEEEEEEGESDSDEEKVRVVEKTNDDDELLVCEGSVGSMRICDLWCKELGRGHVHVARCEGNGKDCNVVVNGKLVVKHCDKLFSDNKSYDLVKCNYYWEEILKFENRIFTEDEKKHFIGCDHWCEEDHGDSREEKRKYCSLELWHRIVKLGVFPKPDEFSFESWRNGHLFTCRHENSMEPLGRNHTIIIIDRSGSMSKNDNGRMIPTVEWLWKEKKLRNRLGMVYQEVNKFIRNRVWLNGKNESFSVVMVNDKGVVMFENERGCLESNENRVKNLLKMFGFNLIHPGGKTQLYYGFKEAFKILERNRVEGVNSSILLFTDGEDYPQSRAKMTRPVKRLMDVKPENRTFGQSFKIWLGYETPRKLMRPVYDEVNLSDNWLKENKDKFPGLKVEAIKFNESKIRDNYLELLASSIGEGKVYYAGVREELMETFKIVASNIYGFECVKSKFN